MSINDVLVPATDVTVRSYRHAARIFTDDNYRLSPKYGFLFYVEFEFNPDISNISSISTAELGMIVKSVTLPKFTIDTKIHNAYNRKNISQHKISYDPVNIVFHDDQAENVRNFWYDYYSFFYRDSDYANSTYQAISKYQQRPAFDWGYSPRPQGSYTNAQNNQPYQYIQSIRVYSLFQKNFSEYELVNPIISKFNHGEHANGDNTSILKHDMTIQYEAVKYYTGYVTENNVGGFIDLHYDNTPSPLAPAGGTDLVSDNVGGYVSAPDTITDLASLYPLPAARNVSNPVVFYGLGLGLSGALGGATRLAATAGINSAGFSIPNLGALTAGITNSAILGQQLQAAGAALAGSAAATLANGVIGGLANGLGPGGTAVIGLIAQVIANPTAALNTIKNMAINYATTVITNFISNTIIQPITNLLGEGAKIIGGYIADNIISPITAGFNGIVTGVAQSIADVQANFQLLQQYGTVDVGEFQTLP